MPKCRNAEIRWKKHCSNNDKKSEVAEHLKNPGHTVNWQVTTSASHQQSKQKILEVYYITNSNVASITNLTLRLLIFLEMVSPEYIRVIHI